VVEPGIVLPKPTRQHDGDIVPLREDPVHNVKEHLWVLCRGWRMVEENSDLFPLALPPLPFSCQARLVYR
jgi:hypothetical protein